MAAPVSAQAARALEQVKMGLYMLYGASYFTEDEWIKIDGLIHKGQYVFTNGPSLLDGNFDGELMSFDDGNNKPDLTIQMKPDSSFDTVKEDTFVVTETQVDSPTESDRADSATEPAETPTHTSIETSSDDEVPAKAAEPDPAMFDFSQWDPPAESTESTNLPEPSEATPEAVSTEVPVETETETNTETSAESPADEELSTFEPPKREPVEIPSAGGLALGYTQAQLDEIKAFNQSLTKAGKKGKRRAQSPSPSSQPSEATTHAPTPSEHENRIQSWASEVDAQEPMAEAPSPGPVLPVIANEFIKTYGRQPKSINDLVQPNNPAFVPLDRRTPRIVAPIKKPKSTGGTQVFPQVNVAPGTILIAQSNQPKRSTVELDVRSGDHIRMLKHVSGINHQAQNMRTNLRGQISENVFKKSPDVAKIDPTAEQQRAFSQRTPSISSNGLDGMERRNAAEWDDVSVSSRQRSVTAAKPKPFGGLGSSRFAVLDETKSVVSSASEDMVSREEVAKMVDEKFAQLLASRNGAPPPTGPHLHAFLPPSSSTPANLRMGKPTWGALADSIPPPTTAQIQAQIAPTPAPLALGQGEGESMMRDPSKAFKTCWYWANDTCQNTAETCRYLHNHCAAGVAPKPSGWKNNWSRWGKSEATDEFGRSATWRRDNEQKAEDEEEGELVLETVDDGGDWKEEDENGWGESAQPPGSTTGSWNQDHLNNGWGDPADKYKPPHVKALEEKSLKEQVGW
ncbi:hypothetical protein ONS95_001913 [Cadophora gregata]|uniref:uncharacterized protein n=1 Tax=Cadophora gregata TaxID=51156 RepID=UPI0026DC8A96|nr:uncharacterized protein ONS95_001913 [Cadophora gregata]KAK0111562.1 hypothetical protein ONS95_001913 [Cadophora gregata]